MEKMMKIWGVISMVAIGGFAVLSFLSMVLLYLAGGGRSGVGFFITSINFSEFLRGIIVDLFFFLICINIFYFVAIKQRRYDYAFSWGGRIMSLIFVLFIAYSFSSIVSYSGEALFVGLFFLVMFLILLVPFFYFNFKKRIVI